MEKKQEAPKRPFTPFFLFRDSLKINAKIGGKEAGEKWRALTKEEKKPFIDQYTKSKEEFDKYLEEVEGFRRLSRSRGHRHDKPDKFRTCKIRAICGLSKETKPMLGNIPFALGKVLVFVSLVNSRKNSWWTSAE